MQKRWIHFLEQPHPDIWQDLNFHLDCHWLKRSFYRSLLLCIVFILSCAGIAEFFNGHMNLITYPNWNFLKQFNLFYRKTCKQLFSPVQNVNKKIRLLEKPGWKENNIGFLLWFSTGSRMLLIVGLRCQEMPQKSCCHLTIFFIIT